MVNLWVSMRFYGVFMIIIWDFISVFRRLEGGFMGFTGDFVGFDVRYLMTSTRCGKSRSLSATVNHHKSSTTGPFSIAIIWLYQIF